MAVWHQTVAAAQLRVWIFLHWLTWGCNIFCCHCDGHCLGNILARADLPVAFHPTTSLTDLRKRQLIIESVFPRIAEDMSCQCDEESDDLFKRLDTDEDSHLSAEEFKVYVMQRVVRTHYDEFESIMSRFLRYNPWIREADNSFDKDGDGRISLIEFNNY